MDSSYKPIEENYLKILEEAVEQHDFVRLQYFSEINEFLTKNQVAKKIINKDNADYLVLGNGEEVRLDRIVRFNNNPAPGYDENYFKCDL